MKILFATDLFYQNVAGSINFIQQLVKGLVKDGHQVFVIAPSKTFKNTLTKQGDITVYGIRSMVIPEVIYPSKFRIPITAGSNRIRRIIAEVDPDVISIQDHFMIGSKVAKEGKRLGIPLVGTNHFMPENFIHYLYPPKFAKKMIKELAWKSFVRVYRHLDVITTPTKTAADLIKKLGLKNPIIPISNGINLKKFSPKNNGQYLKKRFNIKSDNLVVLFVGRLDKEKRVDVLIKSFPQVLSEINAKLVITGKGAEKKKLIKLTKRLGIDKNVIFTGFVSDKDLPHLYRIANLFAIASIAELQSIATMEAMASGLPVVAVKVMALPELVHHGQNGYLFNEGNTEMLSSQIIKILKDSSLRKKMSQNSLKLIKNHDISKTIKGFEKVYQALIA